MLRCVALGTWRKLCLFLRIRNTGRRAIIGRWFGGSEGEFSFIACVELTIRLSMFICPVGSSISESWKKVAGISNMYN